MKFGSYLRSKAVTFFLFAVSVAVVVLLLWVSAVATGVVVVCCVLLLLAFVVALVWDYLLRKRFYENLSAVLQAKGTSNYASEFLTRPNFIEGQLSYDVLEEATKDMNDAIARYRIASDEYRDYIETWIHEVKTPIAASRLILENNRNVALQPLDREIERIETYVEQALYYARSTAVEKDYIIKLLDLDQVVKECVKKYSRLLIENGIMPGFENLDTSVYADPKWLDFVLGQIISNSVKYCRPRTKNFTPSIKFTAENFTKDFEVTWVRLHIKDNGIGIPAADVPRVFEKGFTGENGRRFAQSTGIGLYLCKVLCEKMKLKIALSSVALPENQKNSEGEVFQSGTTLTIEFPLNKMYFLD